jgi:hypothetical protein
MIHSCANKLARRRLRHKCKSSYTKEKIKMPYLNAKCNKNVVWIAIATIAIMSILEAF